VLHVPPQQVPPLAGSFCRDAGWAHLDKRMKLVILGWSEADLTDLEDGAVVVPLTAEVHLAARAQDLDIFDVGKLIDGDPPIAQMALRLANDLHAELRESSVPWLEAYANIAFGTQCFQLLTWLRLLRSLHSRLGTGVVVRLPDIVCKRQLQRETFVYGLAQESLLIACDVVAREGLTIQGRVKPCRHRLHPLMRRAATVMSPLLLWMSTMVLATKMPWRRPVAVIGKRDVLLITEQYTDAIHAYPLARQLKAKYGATFAWVGIRPKTATNLTAEEAGFLGHGSLDEVNFFSTEGFGSTEIVTSRWAAALDTASAWQIAGILVRGVEGKLLRRDWFNLLLGQEYLGKAARAAVWNDLLNAAQPRIVVGLSTLQDMALVRGWTRRKLVPFVSLMHGVLPDLRRSHDADADYLGVFGKKLSESPIDAACAKPRRVAPCGPMQFEEKAKIGGGLVSASLYGRAEVLFFGSFESLPFSPVTPEEQCQVINDVHRACREAGVTLRLRPHPRFPTTAWSPFVEKLSKRFPGTIVVSDERSISRDLARCRLCIATIFDGALMDALLAGTPVIAYAPEGKTDSLSATLLEATGGAVQGIEELKLMLSTSLVDYRWRRRIEAQQKFLGEYFDTAELSTWDRALRLIDDALQVEL